MSRETNRWMILAASIICNMNIGAAYAWSVFQKPLVNMFHWTPSEASLTFTFSLAIMPVAMIIAGKIQDQKGPRTVMMVGGVLFGAGIFGSGFAESLNFLYACGFLNGLGIGTVYACAVANTVKWFPDRKGFASGLIAAGLGSGAVVFAPIASYLIQTYDVMVAFKVLGIVYLVFIVIAASMVKAPPAGYKPLGWNPPVMANVAAPGSIDKNWKDMLRDPMFYVLWGMYTVGRSQVS